MRHAHLACTAVFASLVSVSAMAQTGAAYPVKPIRLIVAFPAGGPTDIQARVVARKLNEALGQPVVVENRGGAGGMIGAEAAARAAPDGYTLFLATISVVIAPMTQEKPSYDPVKDFAAVTMVSTTPYIMLVHPSLPVRSVKEFIALAKARPGQLNYASSGSGTPPHLAGELLKSVTGIAITHIPHKGAAPALTDLLAGQVSMLFNNPLTALPQMKAGKARGLAVTTAQRSNAAPDLPTLSEAGVPNVEVGSWFALLAPAATPREIVGRLHAETVKLLAAPDVKSRLEADGAEPVGNSSDELAVYIKAEAAKWGKVVRAAGLRME